MKNIIALIFIGLMIMSCGTTQEVEVQKPVVEEGLPQRQTREMPRRSIEDPEQLAAQIGLSEEKTDEFVTMWNAKAESMRLVREKYRDGDRKVLFAKMQEVKTERDQELQRILTAEELSKFYQVVGKNRSKMDPGMRRSKGN